MLLAYLGVTEDDPVTFEAYNASIAADVADPPRCPKVTWAEHAVNAAQIAILDVFHWNTDEAAAQPHDEANDALSPEDSEMPEGVDEPAVGAIADAPDSIPAPESNADGGFGA